MKRYLLVFITFFLSVFCPVYADWFDADWGYRIPVTIDSGEVDGDLTDYTPYIDLDSMPDSFFDNARSNGGDLVATLENGTTRLPLELANFDAVANGGELYFLADGTLSSSSDSTYYLYYGNNSATQPATDSTYGAENVWTSFDGIYHMEEDPSGSAPQMLDSTGSTVGCTSAGTMLTEDLVEGQLGKALDFEGTDDKLGVPTAFMTAINSDTTGTLSVWFNVDNIAVIQNIMDWNDNGSGWGAGLQVSHTTGNLRYFVGTGSGSAAIDVNAAAGVTATQWAKWDIVQDASTNLKMYKDGVSQTLTGTNSNGWYSVLNLTSGEIARRSDASGFFVNGKIDEVRYTSNARASAWIAAEYSNQNAPGSFYTIGAEEEQPPPDTNIQDINGVSDIKTINGIDREYVRSWNGTQ